MIIDLKIEILEEANCSSSLDQALLRIDGMLQQFSNGSSGELTGTIFTETDLKAATMTNILKLVKLVFPNG